MTETTRTLNELLMRAHDLTRAYGAAADHVRSPTLAAQLEGLRLEHQRVASDLTALVLRLGGQPKGHPDARGPLLSGLATVSSLWSDEAVVLALLRAEEVAGRSFEQALDGSLPDSAREVVLAALRVRRTNGARLRELRIESARELEQR
ncbi:MAG: DUF2383 domain-containing protein [Deltaproteobacteria bacterium]|nr:DUF2383 domain-containing protein [Deltaproteobacteria bacterium]